MSPTSGPTLGAAALLSAPALWSALVTGTHPLADALLHFLAAVMACWCGTELLAALVGPAGRAQDDTERSEESASAT